MTIADGSGFLTCVNEVLADAFIARPLPLISLVERLEIFLAPRRHVALGYANMKF